MLTLEGSTDPNMQGLRATDVSPVAKAAVPVQLVAVLRIRSCVVVRWYFRTVLVDTSKITVSSLSPEEVITERN